MADVSGDRRLAGLVLLLLAAAVAGCTSFRETPGTTARSARGTGAIVTIGGERTPGSLPPPTDRSASTTASHADPADTEQPAAGDAASLSMPPTPSPAGPTTEPVDPPPLVLGSTTVVTPDVQYAAADALQKLDIYAPAGASGLPVVLFVHGGGWTRGDRAVVGSQPKLFNDAGMVFVSIDYRLSPAVQHPAHVDDVAAAIAWVDTHIAKFGGDPTKLVVVGHSAGSHLAALVAVDDRPLGKVAMRPGAIAGAVMLDGSAFDIPDRIAKGDEKLAENCRRAFGSDPAGQLDASPVHHVSAGPVGRNIAPFLLIYLKDDSLNYAQSKLMTDRLLAAGVPATLTRVDNKTHASLATDLGTSDDAAGPMIVEFVKQVTAR